MPKWAVVTIGLLYLGMAGVILVFAVSDVIKKRKKRK